MDTIASSMLPPLRVFSLLCVCAASGTLSGCKGATPSSPRDAASETLWDARGDGGVLPPRICKTPPPLGPGPYFRDITEEVGFGQDKLDVRGLRLASTDINGDGLPDLVVHRVTGNRRDDLKSDPQKRYRRLLLGHVDKGTLTFADDTDSSHLFAIRGGGLGRATHFAIFADVNNDGHVDAFTGTYVNADPKAKPQDPGDRSEILLGDGKGGFSFATKSDISHKEMYSTTSATFLDYDRDGNIDLFVGFFYEIYGYQPANQDRLYRGNGDGTFTEVTDQVGLTTLRDAGYAEGKNSRPTYGVTSCDVDDDGDMDLLISAYGRQRNMLYRNDGGTFVEIGQTTGFASDQGLDYTDDQMYRCFCQTNPSCTAPPPKMDCSHVAWREGVDDQPWRLGGNTFTTACADIDNDGDTDLFNAEIRHWWAGSSADPSQLLLNQGGKPLRFTRQDNAQVGLAEVHSGSWNEGHISAAFFDFDADGLLDLLVMDSDYPDTRTRLYHQKPDHSFEEIAPQAGIAHKLGQQVTVGDFDGDGDLDVVMGTSTARHLAPRDQVHLFENLVGSQSNWLELRLIGAGSGQANTSAIGARVTVETSKGTQTRDVGGGYGTFGMQNGLLLHVGLGRACDIKKISVRWPDAQKSVSTFTAVRANYLVEIRQVKGDQAILRHITR